MCLYLLQEEEDSDKNKNFLKFIWKYHFNVRIFAKGIIKIRIMKSFLKNVLIFISTFVVCIALGIFITFESPQYWKDNGRALIIVISVMITIASLMFEYLGDNN